MQKKTPNQKNIAIVVIATRTLHSNDGAWNGRKHCDCSDCVDSSQQRTLRCDAGHSKDCRVFVKHLVLLLLLAVLYHHLLECGTSGDVDVDVDAHAVPV